MWIIYFLTYYFKPETVIQLSHSEILIKIRWPESQNLAFTALNLEIYIYIYIANRTLKSKEYLTERERDWEFTKYVSSTITP